MVGQKPVGAEAEASPADREFALLSAGAVSADTHRDWHTSSSVATASRYAQSREAIDHDGSACHRRLAPCSSEGLRIPDRLLPSKMDGVCRAAALSTELRGRVMPLCREFLRGDIDQSDSAYRFARAWMFYSRSFGGDVFTQVPRTWRAARRARSGL